MSISPRFHITQLGRPERIVEMTGTTTIGRAFYNDIVLAEISVARCHALLLRRPQDIALINLGSIAPL